MSSRILHPHSMLTRAQDTSNTLTKYKIKDTRRIKQYIDKIKDGSNTLTHCRTQIMTRPTGCRHCRPHLLGGGNFFGFPCEMF